MRKWLVDFSGLLIFAGVVAAAWPSHITVRQLRPEPRIYGAKLYRTGFNRSIAASKVGCAAYFGLIKLGFSEKQLWGVTFHGKHLLGRPGSVGSSMPSLVFHCADLSNIELLAGADVVGDSQHNRYDGTDRTFAFIPSNSLTNGVFHLRVEGETNCFAEVIIR